MSRSKELGRALAETLRNGLKLCCTAGSMLADDALSNTGLTASERQVLIRETTAAAMVSLYPDLIQLKGTPRSNTTFDDSASRLN